MDHEGDKPAFVLSVEGRVERRVREALRDVLPPDLPETCVVLMAQYAEMTIPVGTRFTAAQRRRQTTTRVACDATLLAVTQEWDVLWDEVPQGWKTAVVVDFPNGAPAIIEALPWVDGWILSSRPVDLFGE